jgi:hypothetical protein
VTNWDPNQPYGLPPYGQQPPPGPPPYGPPPPYYGPYPPGPSYQYPQPKTTNGMAIASMILGILWIYWIGSILALIFGYVARNQIRERPYDSGDGMALAGIVLGWIGVGFLVLFIVIIAVAANHSG